jgi:tetratricopeptide (TPR) repeat protein
MVLWGLHEIASYRAETRESLELAEECLKIAEQLDEPGFWLQAHHAVWGGYYYLGQWEQALFHIERGLAYYDHAAHEALSVQYGMHDAGVCALHLASMMLWNLGYVVQAGSKLDAALALSQKLTLSANIADSCAYSGLIYYLLRAPQVAQTVTEPALKMSAEKGYPHPEALCAAALGWSLAAQGRVAEGITLAEQGVATSEKLGQQAHRSMLIVLLIETYLLAGRHDAAVRTADKGIAEFRRYRDLLCAPDLWTLKGDALLALGAAEDQAEACYQDALALARELRAKISELRAAVSLARLRQRQGRPVEGYRLLHDVYSWFTEGFEAVDLQTAAQLLRELAPA